MSERQTRGKPSKVDLLPEAIKDRLNSLLRGGRLTQSKILNEVNQAIEAAGLPDDKKLSRSGINRYATKIETVGKNLRELREVSSALVAKLGDKPTGDLSRLILEIGRTQLFKAMMSQSEEEEVDIGMVKDAMLAAQRLESAAMQSHKRETEIRKAFAVEAAKAAEEVAVSAGMTAQTAAAIRKEILGIA